jgi:hypothetical protein
MRRRDLRPDRFGQDAADGIFVEGNGFCAEHAPQPGFFERGLEAGFGVGEGNIVEVDGHAPIITADRAGLLPVGILGALAGSYLGSRRFSGLWTRRILGVVLLAAIVNYVAEQFG